MAQGLIGKVALGTGASRGIRRAIALRLAGEGAAVVVNYFRPDTPSNRLFNTLFSGSSD
jgi:NAD(P)-dependent dehydrogenase (short-subunit alcohol dehydrogenase family)